MVEDTTYRDQRGWEKRQGEYGNTFDGTTVVGLELCYRKVDFAVSLSDEIERLSWLILGHESRILCDVPH